MVELVKLVDLDTFVVMSSTKSGDFEVGVPVGLAVVSEVTTIVGSDEGALVGSEKLTVALVPFTTAPNVVFTVVVVG